MEKSTNFPVRLDNEMLKTLKKLRYLTDKTIAQLIRDGVELLFEQNKKLLQKNKEI